MYSAKIANILKGHFTIGTYIPEAGGWVYTAEGPQFIDGQILYTAGSAPGVVAG
jgi:hypothetical protein